MKGLTEKQADVLDFVIWHVREEGFQPTIREIMHEFEWHYTNAVETHLAALAKKGYIRRTGKCRAIQILKNIDGTPVNKTKEV